ncbi:MAG: crossover junction endodeoxyribonuclease RuvC [Elusimicrobiota bacterium]
MIILGIDPGMADTGWAVVEALPAARSRLLGHGVVRTEPPAALPERLARIHAGVLALLEEHRPDQMAVEEMFFLKAAHTVRATLQARGVILLAAAQRGVSVSEYNPRQVKLALTGSGSAEKPQMQRMVMSALGLADIPRPDDAADAAALALCHLRSMKGKGMRVLERIGKGGG